LRLRTRSPVARELLLLATKPLFAEWAKWLAGASQDGDRLLHRLDQAGFQGAEQSAVQDALGLGAARLATLTGRFELRQQSPALSKQLNDETRLGREPGRRADYQDLALPYLSRRLADHGDQLTAAVGGRDRNELLCVATSVQDATA